MRSDDAPRARRRSTWWGARVSILLAGAGMVLLALWIPRAFTPARDPISPHERVTASPRGGLLTPLTVVGLGDSVPSGAACGCVPYVDLVGQQLGAAVDRAASVANLAISGLTSSALVAQLHDAAVRDTVSRADLVIVTIGANDFDEATLTSPLCASATGTSCSTGDLTALQRHLTGILTTIDALAPRARVVVTGYWNVFRDGEVGRDRGAAYVEASNALTLAVNRVISADAAQHSSLYVDTREFFKGPEGTTDCTALLAADGDHPNAAGHRLIADAVTTALRGHLPLRPASIPE